MKGETLFLGKKNNFYCEQAAQFIAVHFPKHMIYLGERGDPFPDGAEWWDKAHIISYLSPWVIPEYLLNKSQLNINFHPAPPEYPGIGCTNFAIYDGVGEYGVTCHHMAPQVDTGAIISVKRFPVFKSDTVYTLTQRSYGYLLQLFYEIAEKIVAGGDMPTAVDRWSRKPYTRRELDELCQVTQNMAQEEVERRVRAVTFPGAPGAFLTIGKMRFTLGRV